MIKKVFSATFIVLIVLSLSQYGCKYEQPVIPQTCDTTVVTFSGTVMPILTGSCRVSGCHLGNNPPNGVFLDDYPHVKAQLVLVNGTPLLLGVIEHLQGFDFMPKGLPKLDECNIAKIRKWVREGALNN